MAKITGLGGQVYIGAEPPSEQLQNMTQQLMTIKQ